MSVVVQLPPNNDIRTMPTPSTSAAATQHSAEAMIQSIDSTDKPSDLPPMPVPYEDFHFSLDLPAELDLNDLQFISSADRRGGPSNPMTPGLTSHFLASTPQAIAFGHDDVHMASRSNSRRGSLSKGSRPASPRIGSLRFSESALRPPPPPDFEPSGPNMFDVDAFANGTLSPFGIGTPSGADNKPLQNGPLFDAKEKNLLVNFLEGFEWDFDPSLPEGMPSFSAAAAERSAAAAEAMGFPADLGSAAPASRDPMLHEGPAMSAAARRLQNKAALASGSSGSNSGSATASSQSPHDTSSTSTSPHGSNRGNAPRRSHSNNNNKGRSFHHEADLVNTAFGGGLSEWSSATAAPHQPPVQHAYPPQHAAFHDNSATGSKRHAGHFGGNEADEQTQAALALGSLTGMHAEMFRMSAGLDMAHRNDNEPNNSIGSSNSKKQGSVAQLPRASNRPGSASKQNASGKKLKTEHEDDEDRLSQADASAASRRELLTESEKRQNHILSEQRRRNYIREGFKDLVVLLDDGRNFGARALGLSSGFGTGVEDEGLDDRTDVEDVVDVLSVGRKKPPKKAKKAGPDGVRQRGKGRGRGGSAGGGAGSKSAVLFQAVDLIRWLDGKSKELTQQCEALEQLAGIQEPEAIVAANRPASAAKAA
ncbi:hypothetical protein EX895_000994 [Sporisorium graminicola]|uniref:BHLH domain-containing protein n=1 Tax=Sporisorium graminicola TaxID=280036 RepID=A0A4U7L1C3_9BASI|nr:hypothetical protein EX895_000994 [Sporisorium graminicola]TKY90995.1 hypothetical protein EX895_000994 [Sporisorium graminicola]